MVLGANYAGKNFGTHETNLATTTLTKQTSALTDTLILDKILNPSFTIGRLRCQLVSRSSVAATKCWVVFFLHCSGDTGCRRLLTARRRLDSRQKTLIFFSPLTTDYYNSPIPFMSCPRFFFLYYFFSDWTFSIDFMKGVSFWVPCLCVIIVK